jgi:hypothetical protein
MRPVEAEGGVCAALLTKLGAEREARRDEARAAAIRGR